MLSVGQALRALLRARRHPARSRPQAVSCLARRQYTSVAGDRGVWGGGSGCQKSRWRGWGPARREQEPRCCSGSAGLWVCKPGPVVWSRGLEAGQRLPRPGQSPKHGMLTPTSLPKLAEGHFPCHPPDGHCVREAHSGAATECNSTGANQVLVPTVQWPELPSPHPWLSPGQQSVGRAGALA